MAKGRLLLLGALLFALTLTGLVGPAGAAGETVRVLSITGPVTPAMVSYFERGISMAEREGAVAVIIVNNQVT